MPSDASPASPDPSESPVPQAALGPASPPALPGPPAAPSSGLASRAGWARRSVSLKMVAIGGLILLLLVPLTMLRSLIGERQMLRANAEREVSAGWGGAQTVAGPVLSVPYLVVRTPPGGQPVEERGHVHFLPEALDVEGEVTPEIRTRGIFRVVLYNAKLRVSGRFAPVDVSGLGIPAEALRPDEAFVSVGIPDMAGVRETIRLGWGEATLTAESGVPTTDVFGSGVHVPVGLPAAGGTPFRLDLDLNGSRSLGFLPLGRETRVRLTSPWSSPGFTGAFLPETREVSAEGFTASWRVLSLNRNYGQAFRGAFGQSAALADGSDVPYVEMLGGREGSSAFGVRLLLPVDEYQKTERAAKYGFLFVCLTFLTFFFVEILGGRRIHPMQYLLVGFAVTLFYLLLLSFAEFVPFDAAYGLAVLAVVPLVGLYARAVFGEARLAVGVAGVLLLFYGYFYVLLQLEAYALLVGSLGLLTTLALVMYLSRGVDWYNVGTSASEREASPRPGALRRPLASPAAEG